MGFKLNDFELHTFEVQLNKLASKIVFGKNILHVLVNKVINIRTLQMDGMIDENDEVNDYIDLIEDDIKNARIILEEMTCKLLFFRDQLSHEDDRKVISSANHQRHEQMLEHYTRTMNQFVSSLTSCSHLIPITAAIRVLSDLDRRKRRKLSNTTELTMTQSLPLPSPPELKIPFVNATTDLTIQQQQQKNNNDVSIPISPQTSPVNDKSVSSSSSSSSSGNYFHAEDIIHDPNYCMFKIQLDTKGNTAALCYLPTRYKNIIEFYHIEIPIAYRYQGLGDFLLSRAFQWVKKSNLLVIPTCPFVRKYLETRFPDKKSEYWSCIVLNEYNKFNGCS
ncbi:MAG: hypothetical protein EXX96DRAFT_618345 [Benjaminiella poitrasii]|nr:MAG: hypothetical protein EXX96DRAFT_618345 [Benjaminiella poitrasii]